MSRQKLSNEVFIQTGTGTLVAGALLILNLRLEATTRVFLTRIAAAAPAITELSYTITAGATGSIAVDSTDAADVGVFAWMAVTPAGNPSQ